MKAMPIDAAPVQILSLMQRYCWAVDHRLWEEWVQCWVENGAFEVRGKRLVGIASIRDFVEGEIGAYQMLRHLQHAPEIQIQDATTATVRSYFELKGRTPRGTDVEALGSYEDICTYNHGRWQLQRRRATFDYFVRRGEAWTSGGDSG